MTRHPVTTTGTVDAGFVDDPVNTAEVIPGPEVVDTNPNNNMSTDTTTVVSPANASGMKEVSGEDGVVIRLVEVSCQMA